MGEGWWGGVEKQGWLLGKDLGRENEATQQAKLGGVGKQAWGGLPQKSNSEPSD